MSDSNNNLYFSPEDLRALQLKNLDLVLYFKKFCEENNLLFYFCGGCCIGAIRHGGFIPWDDDIDIFMPREDYEKLFRIWEEKADLEHYSCVRTTDKVFTGKVITTIVDNQTTFIKPEQKDFDIPHGVALDVFPLDGYPASKFARKKQIFWALIYSLYLAQIVPQNHGKAVSLLGKMMLWIVPSKKLRYKIWKFAEKQMSKYKIEDCDSITELCAGPGYMKNRYPKEAFTSAVFHNFEGYEMPLPKGYDAYLRIAFGDYMKLPPKEKQVAHHDVAFWDLNNSYKKYKGIEYCMEEKK